MCFEISRVCSEGGSGKGSKEELVLVVLEPKTGGGVVNVLFCCRFEVVLWWGVFHYLDGTNDGSIPGI